MVQTANLVSVPAGTFMVIDAQTHFYKKDSTAINSCVHYWIDHYKLQMV